MGGPIVGRRRVEHHSVATCSIIPILDLDLGLVGLRLQTAAVIHQVIDSLHVCGLQLILQIVLTHEHELTRPMMNHVAAFLAQITVLPRLALSLAAVAEGTRLVNGRHILKFQRPVADRVQ